MQCLWMPLLWQLQFEHAVPIGGWNFWLHVGSGMHAAPGLLPTMSGAKCPS